MKTPKQTAATIKPVDPLAELKAKHAAELKKATTESEIREAIEKATGLSPRTVHLYSIYGREASASFGDSYYSAPFASLGDALKLAEAFPLVPRVMLKEGCTSFPVEAWLDKQPGTKEKEKKGQITGVAPFFLEADFACTPQHGHTPKIELTWAAEIAGRVVEISVVLPPHEVCRWSFTGENRQNTYKRVTSTELAFVAGWAERGGDSCPALHHQIGGDFTQDMDRIHWGRGSDDSGHKFTFYSGCYDADLSHHLRRVIELTTKP